MRLLVSVSGPDDALAAIEGGADIIDAKDASQGALGAVSPSVMREIITAANGRCPVSMALGDAPDSSVPMRLAALRAGDVSFVKLGFAAGVNGQQGAAHARSLADALTGTGTGVVLAAYADARHDRLDPGAVTGIAAACGAIGVLMDTQDKRGARPVFSVLDPEDVAAWVAEAHRAGLLAAIAGSLGAGEIALARDIGADVVGVRGAVCDGGRNGRVSPARVRSIVMRMHEGSGADRGVRDRDAGVS